jgi:soluble P-type ATPase
MFLCGFQNAGNFGAKIIVNIMAVNTADIALCGINQEGNYERLDLSESY